MCDPSRRRGNAPTGSSIHYTPTVTLNKQMLLCYRLIYFSRHISQVHIVLYIFDIKQSMKIHFTFSSPSTEHQYAEIHANCAETTDTELYCGHLGLTISASKEQNPRNVSIAIRCAFSKTMKIRQYRCKCDCLYTIHTVVTPPLHTRAHTNNTHNRASDPTVIQ